MSTIIFPPWWSGGDTDAKINWLLTAHHARTYSAAASMLAKMRRPKRQLIPPPARLTPQEFAAEQERRHLD